MARQRQTFIAETSGSETMTRYSKSIGTFLGTLLLAAGLTLGLGAPPALGGDVDVGPVDLPPGESLTITYDTELDDPLTPPTLTPVCNQGTVSGTNFGDVMTDDPDVGGGSDPTCTDIVFNGDLGIVKTSPDPVLTGAVFDYTITVSNAGPDAIPNVEVTDTVPGDLAINSISGCGAGSGIAVQVVTCTLGTITAGSNAVFTINVTAPGAAVANVSNTATITTANTNPGNDSDTVVIQVVSMVTLTVVVAGDGQGTVTNGGIDCGFATVDCDELVTPGAVVVLTAAAEAGSAFTGWMNCDVPSGNDCTQTVDGDETVTATFIDLKLLSVIVDGSGQGTVTNGGIDCGFATADCDELVDPGAVVVLTAAAEAGSVFVGWTLCDVPVGNMCTQTVDGDETVTATFIAQFTLTVQVPGAGTGEGGVTDNLSGIDCNTTGTMDCTEDYDTGTEVALAALPVAGSLFSGWTDGLGAEGCQDTAGASPVCGITMNADKTVTANFISVAEATAALEDLVDGLPINNGQKKSFKKKLAGALKNFNKGDIAGAVDKLTSFINELDAFVNAGILTQAQIDPLVDLALAIITAINP